MTAGKGSTNMPYIGEVMDAYDWLTTGESGRALRRWAGSRPQVVNLIRARGMHKAIKLLIKEAIEEEPELKPYTYEEMLDGLRDALTVWLEISEAMTREAAHLKELAKVFTEKCVEHSYEPFDGETKKKRCIHCFKYELIVIPTSSGMDMFDRLASTSSIKFLGDTAMPTTHQPTDTPSTPSMVRDIKELDIPPTSNSPLPTTSSQLDPSSEQGASPSPNRITFKEKLIANCVTPEQVYNGFITTGFEVTVDNYTAVYSTTPRSAVIEGVREMIGDYLKSKGYVGEVV